MAEITEAEGKKLIEAFNKLKIKPKADTPEDLQTWLKAYAGVKVEPVVSSGGTPGTTTSSTVAGASGGPIYTSQYPRISIFYGDKVKGEATYAQWVYEVKSLLQEKTHKPETIAQAIRHSLRGEANNIVRRLGIGVPVDEILNKFNSVYAEVDTKENLLAKFYSAKQQDDEDITKSSCRLEDILSSAVERKLVDPKSVHEMLRNMFWQGLKPTLKDISGYLFEKITDFDQLRVELRKLEQDHLDPESAVPHCPISKSAKTENSDLKEMKTMIQSLSNTVEQLEKKVNTNFQSNQPFPPNVGNQAFPATRGRGKNKRRGNFSGSQQTYYQNPHQNQQPYYQNPNQNQQPYYQNPNPNVQYRQGGFNSNRGGNSNYSQRPNFDPTGYTNYPAADQSQSQGAQYGIGQDANFQNMSQSAGQNQGASGGVEDSLNSGPLCWRCRQHGHFQWQCPVRMDHSRKYLN